MERREIEVFLALAEELHFGRVAERLHLSTARVSQTIQKLERRVGVPLFERTSRQVALTPIGRRLHADLQPAYQQLQQVIERAVSAGRGVTGQLQIGFVGAVAGQYVLEVAEVFNRRHPDCEVQIRDCPVGDGAGLLRTGGIELLLGAFPMQEPDLTAGEVLFREERTLAVSARHPFAGRPSVSFADLARARVLRSPPGIPGYWDAALAPTHTPDGHTAERGPVFGTIQEMLALVGAGRGTFPVPLRVSRYDRRPDVVYVPIHDAPPFEWGLIWLTAAQTGRVRAFSQAAGDLASDRGHRADQSPPRETTPLS